MQQYFEAGYYLIKTKPVTFGPEKGKVVFTCSGCINTHLFDKWCTGWDIMELDNVERNEIDLDDGKLSLIHQWTNDKIKKGELKRGNLFPDLEIAQEFKNLFYKDLTDISIYALTFSETDADNLLRDFDPSNPAEFNFNRGEIGLRENLSLRINENRDSATFLGYDLIGVDGDGSFHSFHCHNIIQELFDRFQLHLNQNGLFDFINRPEELRAYLNAPDTAVEPLPWYIVKVLKIADNLIT